MIRYQKTKFRFVISMVENPYSPKIRNFGRGVSKGISISTHFFVVSCPTLITNNKASQNKSSPPINQSFFAFIHSFTHSKVVYNGDYYGENGVLVPMLSPSPNHISFWVQPVHPECLQCNNFCTFFVSQNKIFKYFPFKI